MHGHWPYSDTEQEKLQLKESELKDVDRKSDVNRLYVKRKEEEKRSDECGTLR